MKVVIVGAGHAGGSAASLLMKATAFEGEILRRPRRLPQPLEPGSPPHQQRHVQNTTLGRPGRVGEARWIGPACPARTPLTLDMLPLD